MSKVSVRIRRIIKSLWIIYFSLIGLFILFLILAAVGAFGYMPDLEELENPRSQLASEIYSVDGVMIGTYFHENRSNSRYEEISPDLINALVAVEDIRFVNHPGIDPRAMGRMIFGVMTFNPKGGASTITQQLAKNLFPRERRSKLGLVLMKFKEWVVATKLERRFTKKEILTLYFNTVSFGSNSYGIKIASKTFFAKDPIELTVDESALLVGLLKAPSFFNPVRNTERAFNRRNVVLRQMKRAGYISEEEYEELIEKPIDMSKHRVFDHTAGIAPYLREYLRRILTDWSRNYQKPDGTSYNIYTDGLKIYTTIDSRMQVYAEEAMREHMKEYLQPEFFKHWQGRRNAPYFRLSEREIESLMQQAMKRTDRYRNMKQKNKSENEILEAFNTSVEMRVFSWDGDIDTVMTPMDSIRYYKFFLRSGMVSIDPQTGHVKAYVGGIDYRHFQYDHVVDAKRQVGSTFKPFVYTIAVQEGETPCSEYPNTPITIKVPGSAAWTPRNSSSYKDGEMVNLREALAQSINRISARLIHRYNPAAVVQLVKRLGITSEIPPVHSISLGSADLSVMEMTAAYAAYANGGVYTKPIIITRIEDRHGTVLQTFTSETHDAMSERTAYIMLEMMKGVVQYGTSVRLRSRYGINYPIAGKTGTTDNNSDGWFIGITPNLVTGVWVGAEDRAAHFRSIALGQGANTSLPIWALYMQRVYKNNELDISKEDFYKPENLKNMIFDCEEYKRQQQSQSPFDRL